MLYLLIACQGAPAPAPAAPAAPVKTPAAPAPAATPVAAAPLAASGAPGTAAPVVINGTLCAAGEDARFSCAAKNGKVISICASPDLSATTGSIQYRFGRPGAVELSYPADPATGRTALTWNTQNHASSQSFNVVFQNGGFTYTVYDQDTMGSASQNGSGILIEKPSAEPISIACTGPTILNIDSLEKILPPTPSR